MYHITTITTLLVGARPSFIIFIIIFSFVSFSTVAVYLFYLCLGAAAPLCRLNLFAFLLCVLLFFTAFFDNPCCAILNRCGSPCIKEMYMCWVVVCCTKINERKGEVLLVLCVQLMLMLMLLMYL